MSTKKILIVDDSPTELSKLEDILTTEGYEVVRALSGKEALEKANFEHPDMIFMDIVMDDIDGYEATRQLTNGVNTNSIPIVFVSGKHQKADRVWAKMQGGKELVAKPYKGEEILQQVKAYAL